MIKVQSLADGLLGTGEVTKIGEKIMNGGTKLVTTFIVNNSPYFLFLINSTDKPDELKIFKMKDKKVLDHIPDLIKENDALGILLLASMISLEEALDEIKGSVADLLIFNMNIFL